MSSLSVHVGFRATGVEAALAVLSTTTGNWSPGSRQPPPPKVHRTIRVVAPASPSADCDVMDTTFEPIRQWTTQIEAPRASYVASLAVRELASELSIPVASVFWASHRYTPRAR